MGLMFAYGSNLCVEHMAIRCPAARKMGSFNLNHARLVFRGVADVEYDEEESCPGGLWNITPECEEALDRYEGVASGLYQKVLLKAKMVRTGKIRKILVYQMCCDGIMPPDEHYLNTIRQGYIDFGLDLNYLDMALQRAWNDKDKTKFLRRRRMRRGNKPFAQSLPLEGEA
jgi:hypothetical protein